jgi:plastocyanin
MEVSMRRICLTLTAVAVLAFGATSAGSATNVSVKDNKFTPRTVTIKKGATVKWTWRGRNPHNVLPFYKTIKKSGTFSKKFSRKGTFSYHCSVHPGMTGRVKVI